MRLNGSPLGDPSNQKLISLFFYVGIDDSLSLTKDKHYLKLVGKHTKKGLPPEEIVLEGSSTDIGEFQITLKEGDYN